MGPKIGVGEATQACSSKRGAACDLCIFLCGLAGGRFWDQPSHRSAGRCRRRIRISSLRGFGCDQCWDGHFCVRLCRVSLATYCSTCRHLSKVGRMWAESGRIRSNPRQTRDALDQLGPPLSCDMWPSLAQVVCIRPNLGQSRAKFGGRQPKFGRTQLKCSPVLRHPSKRNQISKSQSDRRSAWDFEVRPPPNHIAESGQDDSKFGSLSLEPYCPTKRACNTGLDGGSFRIIA